MQSSELFHRIINLRPGDPSNQLILDVAKYQYDNNLLYHNYVSSLKIAWSSVDSFSKIPFLPIAFFKNHSIKTGQFQEEAIFSSSATTGTVPSQHFVKSVKQYEQTFFRIFEDFYGSPADYVILGLLPSYLERSGSSLIHMVQRLIEKSRNPDSGFFLYDHEKLAAILQKNDSSGKKTLLIGVTFALLDFAEHFQFPLKNTIIMETGGMKGRGEELTREEVANRLKIAFGVQTIHSEYGMTELMSQAYSKGNGLFKSPPWMKVLARDTSDPLSHSTHGTGALNIIDLANLDSCSFIATQDLGKVYENGEFEVSGRMDQSDVRGCNLLIL